LGTSAKTVEEWLDTAYLKGEKRRGRVWVKESEIEGLLNRFPRAQISLDSPPEGSSPASVNGVSRIEAADLTSLLREQREALLGFVREPSPPDDSQGQS
jgi:hypothetical protein